MNIKMYGNMIFFVLDIFSPDYKNVTISYEKHVNNSAGNVPANASGLVHGGGSFGRRRLGARQLGAVPVGRRTFGRCFPIFFFEL